MVSFQWVIAASLKVCSIAYVAASDWRFNGRQKEKVPARKTLRLF
jgi:hypothetical protein